MKNSFEVFGVSGPTLQLNVGNAVVQLPDDLLDGRRAIAALITCEDASIRFTFSTAVPTTAFGHIMYNRQSMRLANPQSINTFSAVSETVGSPAVLHITYEYEIGG